MRCFAIIPAAGQSVRMGTPKLLLPWGERTVIEATIAAWRASRVEQVVVVIRADDDALAEVCGRAGAAVVRADPPPPDMKASVITGLEHVAESVAPGEGDAWLLAPADMPWLTAEVIDRIVVESAAHPGEIIVPTHAGHRGHPVAFPWALAGETKRLAENEGIDALVARRKVQLLECQTDAVLGQLNTPEDYRRRRDRQSRMGNLP